MPGKRLSVDEVMRRYAAGDCDFRGANLRGYNFAGRDLSGADLTGADLRSTNFANATLRKTILSYTRCGMQRRWIIVQLLVLVVLAALSGFLTGYSGGLIGYFITSGIRQGWINNLIGGVAGAIALLITYTSILREGYTTRTLWSVAFAGASTFAFAGAFAGASAFAFAGAVAIAGVVAGAGAFVSAGAGVDADASVFASISTVAIAGIVVGTNTIAIAGAGAGAGAGTVVGASTVAVANIFNFLYAIRQVRKEDAKFAVVRVLGIALNTMGGTRFSGADLSDARFGHAILQSTNFADSLQSSTTLHRVRWHKATQLDRARLGSSILQDPRVRHLLTTLDGVEQDFSGCNLRGANLAEARLERAMFRSAILSDATLAEATLQGAILTETQCVGTDFTAAHFTGACLEAWNIDATTQFERIDCNYVFLREEPDDYGDRERRPHDPNKCFQPGDFEKFFKEMLDQVQILIRNGVNPDAFAAAFQKIMAEHPSVTRDSVQAIEKQGDDVLLTLKVPEGTDKAGVERTWDEVYEARLEAAQTAAMLEAETRRAEDLKQLQLTTLSSLGNFLSHLTFNNTIMSDSPISAGDGSVVNTGDLSSTGVFNLGEISGQVSNQINELSDTPVAPDQPSLKDLLAQLQAAIEAESELEPEDKAEALAELAELAKAGQAPQEGAMQKLAKRSMNVLKGIASGLSGTAALVKAMQTIAPLIQQVFGF